MAGPSEKAQTTTTAAANANIPARFLGAPGPSPKVQLGAGRQVSNLQSIQVIECSRGGHDLEIVGSPGLRLEFVPIGGWDGTRTSSSSHAK